MKKGEESEVKKRDVRYETLQVATVVNYACFLYGEALLNTNISPVAALTFYLASEPQFRLRQRYHRRSHYFVI